ncbi:MAG: PQQ-binding-like beta-propeller repeat protein, partial [Nitrospira sp.]|nr:PQQ-binding-like beta-propeller repeat protein [Nitrospira sp.]
DNASPVVGPDGTIYVPVYSVDGLFAINPDGTLKWTGSSNGSMAPAIAGDGTVYAAGGGTLRAFNPINGNTLWSYTNLGYMTYGSPTIGPDGTIYISGSPGSGGNLQTSVMYAIKPDGTLKWSWDSGSICWIESSPAIGLNGDIYLNHNCLGLVALDANGQLKWTRDGGLGQVWNSPSIGSDGTIYLGSSDHYFHALNPDGTHKWQVRVENWMYLASSAISTDGSTIYRGDNRGIFYAFDKSGFIKWTYDTGIDGVIYSAPALAANGIVYFTQDGTTAVGPDDKGYLYALRAADGALLWKYEIGWSSSSPAIAADGTLYVVGDAGSSPLDNAVLYAFKCADGICAVPTPALTLTVTKAGTGSGTVTSNPAGINCGTDCSQSYTSGTVVTLTATPATDSNFGGWSGDPDCTDGQVTVNADKTCIATFNLRPPQTFTLTVTKAGTGSGTVTSNLAGIDCGSDCTENYNSGTEVTLTA